MPAVVPMGEAAGTLPESDAVITGGTIDALCDQIVAGAYHPGDVLVIFGATLIVWAVCDEWLVAPGLISYPHTTPDRFLIGGPSNAGALFVDWARRLLRGTPQPGPDRERLDPRLGEPGRVPVWLPYVRGERTPFEDHTLRSNLYGLDIGSGAEALERAAYEASGFVVRRMLDRCGVKATASWPAAAARASRPGWPPWPTPPTSRSTPSPCPRAPRWAPRTSPAWRRGSRRRWTTRPAGPPWADGSSRTRPGCGPLRRATRSSASSARARSARRAQPFGVKATFRAPLRSWRASALRAGHHSSRAKRWVSIGVMSSRPSATNWR